MLGMSPDAGQQGMARSGSGLAWAWRGSLAWPGRRGCGCTAGAEVASGGEGELAAPQCRGGQGGCFEAEREPVGSKRGRGCGERLRWGSLAVDTRVSPGGRPGRRGGRGTQCGATEGTGVTGWREEAWSVTPGGIAPPGRGWLRSLGWLDMSGTAISAGRPPRGERVQGWVFGIERGV